MQHGHKGNTDVSADAFLEGKIVTIDSARNVKLICFHIITSGGIFTYSSYLAHICFETSKYLQHKCKSRKLLN